MDTGQHKEKTVKGKRKLKLEIRDSASKRSEYDAKDRE